MLKPTGHDNVRAQVTIYVTAEGPVVIMKLVSCCKAFYCQQNVGMCASKYEGKAIICVSK